MKNRGFTLIELLVVISIISLLSTVVMASLNSSRAKAQEATIKQDLQSIKTQAELSHGKTGDYSTVETDIAPILVHINANGGTAKFMSSNSFSGTEQKRYGVSVKFNSDNTKNWSVSDSGNVSLWDNTDTKKDGTEGIESMNWNEAVIACNNSGGRMPTVEELKGLWDVYNQTPLNMQPEAYLSSNTYDLASEKAWAVIMSIGFPIDVPKDYPFLVRCVR